MRRVDHHDDLYPVEPTIAGPLFDRSPYDHSPSGPHSEMEEIVAKLIFQFQGRDNPISIARICSNTNISDREVKGIVEILRKEHRMPIGGRRGTRPDEPSGYFWIVDAEDREMATAPYRRQILTMWETLRRIDTVEHLRELREKMTVEEPNS